MTAIVLDAALTLCWAFADEDHPAATAALDWLQRNESRVPNLWWLEVRNALIMNERRSRLTEASATSFLRNLSQLAITGDHGTVDAAYLELAQRESLTLATLDIALQQAAQRVGIPVLTRAP